MLVLLAAGASVDAAQPGSGLTALHVGALRGQEGAVRALLAARASCGLQSAEGATPLCLASAAGHVEVARALLENGGGCGASLALTLARERGHDDVCAVLLEAAAA